MWSFLARRLLYMVPVLFAATVIIFLLITIMPGTFVELFCNIGCPSVARDRYYEQYGLNDPVVMQYSRWLYGLVGSPEMDFSRFPFIHFSEPSFGFSFLSNSPAFQSLVGGGRWFWSLMVWISAMTLSWLIAIPLGIYAATHKDRFSDRILGFMSYLGMSMPSFIVALGFIYIILWQFHLVLDPFFQIGTGTFLNREYQDQPYSFMGILNFLWHFVPPVVVIAFGSSAAIYAHMRSKMLDVLDQAFVQTARAKGLKERRVVHHAFRNALTPLIGMLGTWMPILIENTLVVAVIFGIPLVETAFLGAVNSQNMIVAMSGIFLFTVILIVSNLISDLFLALSDPRIRYE